MGVFNCTPGGSTATTTLAGPYVKVADTCGAVSQSVSCDADLDLLYSTGTDCVVPAGASVGDTHASRSGFYHLNRIAEHARYYLPSNAWLTQQLTDNVNLNATCNAFWNGSVNFYKSGGGCNNTGEIAGVFLHEWGHGMDQNDGGGYDNPSEAYADITAFMNTHVSCVGRGFFQSGQCSGYGNACLNCTGIRDQDWDQRTNHTPSTPQGFLTTNCSSGGGPCAKEVHCEGYVGGETLWDLAARDLPAAGLDLATSWQLADRLWYKSRNGSGGNAYTCSLPNSDGCAATTWFSKLRTIDDDDGNLANGTPHAAAIFAAFKRHNIACGAAADASNQNSTSCPALGATTLTGTAGSASATLTWTAVPNAVSYYILRNDAGCTAGSTIVATVAAPTTTYTDSGLVNGFSNFYRVQAVGSNSACEGILSNCKTLTPQPFAGSVRLDASVYNCAAAMTVTVTDANIGGSTTTVAVSSATETTPETVTLTQTSPGSANYVGTITLTSAPPAANGLLSVANGDTITASYIDADDGQGGNNLLRQTTGTTDCVAPIISNVASSNITGNSARITWLTNENATSVVNYGLAPTPGSTVSNATKVTAHTMDIAGLAECSGYVYSVQSVDAVGNSASDNNTGLYYALTTGKNTQPNYTSTDGPVPIPDNNTTGASSFITVTDAKTIQDVNVKVNITHTFDGDITLYLIAPNSTQVTLSAKRGSSGDNFTNTVFDDEAATPISSGAAPFTGSFRPETLLSALDGMTSAGTWRLKVVDNAGIDVGTIDNWTLSLTYPAAACGPHSSYVTQTLVADTCSTGGAGNGNSIWDAGESEQVKVTITNDGTNPLTGVTVTLTPTTPGVTMTTATASYPTIAAGANADSLAPHFTAHLDYSLACGGSAGFNVTITANEGIWTGSFTHAVGQVLSGNSTPLNENFAGGIPGTWTIVDGGSGGGAASTWTTANPGVRAITAPMTSPVAIVDSDNAGTGNTQDEQMITAAVSGIGATTVTLEFDQYFHWYSGGTNEIADVDVRSAATGGAWVNVLRMQGAEGTNPDHRTISISAQAVGAPDVQVRFHYYQGTWEWWWQVDNIKVTTTGPVGCVMNVCAGPPSVPHPVPDGTFGSGMTAARLDPSATSILLNWDVVTCSSTNHHLLYGDLATVSSYAVNGSSCSLGTTGTATWSGVPGGGDIWFVVVGDDAAGTEGSWGKNSAGAERGGTSPSNQCGDTVRNNGGTCP